MTIKEVLELNIKALQNVRVPLGEPEIYQAIRNTINDLGACVDAMAKNEAEEAQDQEEPEEQETTEEADNDGI